MHGLHLHSLCVWGGEADIFKLSRGEEFLAFLEKITVQMADFFAAVSKNVDNN